MDVRAKHVLAVGGIVAGAFGLATLLNEHKKKKGKGGKRSRRKTDAPEVPGPETVLEADAQGVPAVHVLTDEELVQWAQAYEVLKKEGGVP